MFIPQGIQFILKEIDHYPKSPGLTEGEYGVSYAGTSKSNRAQEIFPIADTVDAYMWDSGPSNISMVGHRMWCLAQRMRYTGFAKNGIYSTMFVQDKSRKKFPDWKVVAFPPAGYVPVDYFNWHESEGIPYACSVALNLRHYKFNNKYEVEVCPLDDQLRRGDPIPIRYKQYRRYDGILYGRLRSLDGFSAKSVGSRTRQTLLGHNQEYLDETG
ncbi:MAG: hypothetical protein N2C12_12795 [Planctomycetales bacterium]